MALHDAAIKDEYFVKRRLAPNVDFWYVLSFVPLRVVCSLLPSILKNLGGEFARPPASGNGVEEIYM